MKRATPASLLRRGVLRLPPVRRAAARRGAEHHYRLLLEHGQVRPLSARDLRLTTEYAQDVLGDAVYAGELRLYASIRGAFAEGWIPDSFFGTRVMPGLTSAVVRRLGFARSLLSTFVGSDVVPDLGHRASGRWVDARLRPTTRAAIAATAMERGSRVVLKRDGSRTSQGVTVLTVAEFRDAEPDPGADLTVQSFVTAHPDLMAISPGGTPPVRILTVFDAGSPSMAAAHVRLGLGATAAIGGPASLRAPVSADGALTGIAADASWRLHIRHPTTGIDLDGPVVPSFATAVEQCLGWHRRLPQAGIVAWDVAVDAEGVVRLLEWNLYWPGIIFHEALAGPNFARFGWERFAPTA